MEHDPKRPSITHETPRRSPGADVEGSTRAALPPLGPRDRLVVSVGEAAELLGISRAFAYELVARGDLPVIRLGRRRLVPKVALLALVEANRSSDAAE